MKQHKLFPALFAFVMLVFVVFLIWYIPAVTKRNFELQDIEKSLETSRGRERKQQYEYDKVVSEIPEVRTALDQILPQAENAKEEVTALKAERKRLRGEKKKLEKQLSGEAGQEDDENE